MQSPFQKLRHTLKYGNKRNIGKKFPIKPQNLNEMKHSRNNTMVTSPLFF